MIQKIQLNCSGVKPNQEEIKHLINNNPNTDCQQ